MKTVNYIIGFRKSYKNDRRTENLILTLQWLINVKNILLEKTKIKLQIIIIEQDSCIKLDIPENIKKEIQHLFIYNNGFYNRGWAFNVGYEVYKGDYYFFADCDIIMKTNDIIDVIETCFKYEAINPYSQIFDSTEEYVSNEKFNPLCWISPEKLNFNERKDTCFTGGIMGISEYAFKILAGWDERFRGRGWEDYGFTAKLNLFCNNTHTYNYQALHLWHPCEIFTTKEINIKINEEYKNYNFKDYLNLVETNNIFGSPVKYSITNEQTTDMRKISDYRYDRARRRFDRLLSKYKTLSNVFFVLCEQFQYIDLPSCVMNESGGAISCASNICHSVA